MNIEKSLKEYRMKKGKIDTIRERCKYWQYCLDTMTDDEIAKEFVYEETNTYGMPKPKNNKSPVETTIINTEVTREMVKQWIKDDESRVRVLEYEVKQIEIALGSLTEEENYIIECKCLDNWRWRQVEIEFNKKYIKELTEEQLKKKKAEAIKKMEKILND